MDATTFPKLKPGEYAITSSATEYYNCIAWAAGDAGKKWWPANYFYWPRTARREETLDAFIEAFGTLGYQRCDDGKLEPDYEKVAVYTTGSEPTHAARQLADGHWTSKLGAAEDIRHVGPESVEGPAYGRVACYLRRKRSA